MELMTVKFYRDLKQAEKALRDARERVSSALSWSHLSEEKLQTLVHGFVECRNHMDGLIREAAQQLDASNHHVVDRGD